MRYALQLALSGIRRSWLLSLLIVASLAIGISAFATTLMIRIGLSADPAPTISRTLYHVELDLRDSLSRKADRRPLSTLALYDVKAISDRTGVPSAATSSAWLPYRSDGPERRVGMLPIRGFTYGAQSVFDLKLISGSFWRREDDEAGSRVAVISRSLSREIFGVDAALGKELELATRSFVIVGVVEDWSPAPRFHDLRGGAFTDNERLYIPLSSWIALPNGYGMGGMTCRQGILDDPSHPSCAWLQFWVRLEDASVLDAFFAALKSYAEEQIEGGRSTHAYSNVVPLLEWLEVNDVIPEAVHSQLWFAAGILIICLVNASGLFLAGFVDSAMEIGIRRSLGATRRDVVMQFVLQSAVLGTLGGILSVPLVLLGFHTIKGLAPEYTAHISLPAWMVLLSPAIALLSALLSAAVPVWRASRLPASLLPGGA
ncbi:ABC transporter permease [Stenotrophomonas maltophilia]|uniref:ABC transporter permease n=1 Tax=Stenotrophomonas sp. RAC2 TaxID=3064902 RepID=UPI001312BBE2|nr:ABC transporter permease [Stenotrophomonas sp. RAC2]MBH1430335.1 ABC transporter permease [Stenotrophomonas maltophilia]MDV9041465.1 ABC transporter permease [Stenotrophomonas sp. RAC2]